MARVTKYIRYNEEDMGKGFITHEDAAKIKFEIVSDLGKLYGETVDVDAWIAKWSCTLTDKATFDAEKNKEVTTLDNINTKCDEIINYVKK